MNRKVNIYHFVNSYFSRNDHYVNTMAFKIVDEYGYTLLSKEIQKDCILLPKFKLEKQLEIAMNFLEKKENLFIKRELKGRLGKGVHDDIYLIHNVLESYDRWGNFQDYEEEEIKKLGIKWCEKRSFDYYYQEEHRTPEEVDAYMTEERRNYYYNKIKDKIEPHLEAGDKL